MKKLRLLFVLSVFSMCGYSQKIHSPMEILQIMSDSKLAYEIKALEKPVECNDYSENLNYHDVYRVTTDSGLITFSFSPNEIAKPLFEKAEKFFQANEADSALYYYHLTVAADSSLSNVMTYIGQMYGKRGDNATAIDWYKRAINKNYIDYMAHWFLADTYFVMGDIDNAVKEITAAQILNRNNQRIKQSLERIFKKAKRDIEDWYFCPQIELTKISDKNISVALTDKWTSYAMAKALWEFEPGYKESMGVKEGQYSTLEDKECLIALAIGLENGKIDVRKDPQLRILKDAANSKFLQEYILYEILLPENPFVAFQLPEQTIDSIKEYILTIRNKK